MGNIGESVKRGILGNLYSNLTRLVNFEYDVRTQRFHSVKKFGVAPSIFSIFSSIVADMS